MLPKTCFDGQTLKSYDGQTKSMYFLLKMTTYLNKCNTIWDKVSADIKNNLITSLSIIKNF